MTLTRRTLLKRVSLGALALAMGKLPPLDQAGPVTADEMVGVPTLQSAGGAAWLPLDGRVLKARDYPQLHAALREAYYGLPPSADDVEFQIPDLRGVAAFGQPWETPAGPNPAVMPMMRADGHNVGEVHWRIKA